MCGNDIANSWTLLQPGAVLASVAWERCYWSPRNWPWNGSADSTGPPSLSTHTLALGRQESSPEASMAKQLHGENTQKLLLAQAQLLVSSQHGGQMCDWRSFRRFRPPACKLLQKMPRGQRYDIPPELCPNCWFVSKTDAIVLSLYILGWFDRQH